MYVSRLVASSALLFGVLASPAAHAHEVRAQVTQTGLDFIGDSLIDLLPATEIPLPVWEKDIPFTCFEAKQRDTVLSIHKLTAKVTAPEPGKLRIAVNVSAEANGVLTIEDAYLCAFAQSCSDKISIDDATLTVQFDVSGDGGQLAVTLDSVEIDVRAEDIKIKVCDGIAGAAISGFLNQIQYWAHDILFSMAESMAEKTLAPMIVDAVGGLDTSYQTAFMERDISAALSAVVIDSDGIGVGVDVDVSSTKPAAECIQTDPGEPEPAYGQPPAFSETAHLGVNLNVGLLNDALYHAWRDGLTCVTGESLAGLGLDVHHLEEQISHALPGLPPQTTFEIHGAISKPPRIEGRLAEGAGIAIVIEGIEVQVVAAKPDGTVGTITVELDVFAMVEAQIDPTSNAIVMAPREVTMRRMEIHDQLLDSELGLDAAALRTAVQNNVIPQALAEVGRMPVAAPVFGKERFNLIMTDLKSSPSHIAVEAKLYVAPRTDGSAPTTEFIEAPGPLSNPRDAAFLVAGTDAEIPSDLLRYVVTVNGVKQEPNGMRRFKVGEVGVSASYQVQVQAMDLAGNTDKVGVTQEVFVDGIAPALHIVSDRGQQVKDTSVELEWRVTDDHSSSEKIVSRIDVFRLTDPTNIASDELVDSYDVAGTQTTVSVDDPGTYRIAIVAVDEAGNETAGSVLLTMSGGCSAGTSRSSALWLLTIVGLALISRRRRVRR